MTCNLSTTASSDQLFKLEDRLEAWKMNPGDAVPPKLVNDLRHCDDPLREFDSNLIHQRSHPRDPKAARKLGLGCGTFVLDLHGYSVWDAIQFVDRRIPEAQNYRFQFIKLIHGSPDVKHWRHARATGRGWVKWRLLERFRRGDWSDRVYEPDSPRHRIRDGFMQLALRERR